MVRITRYKAPAAACVKLDSSTAKLLAVALGAAAVLSWLGLLGR
jgi:hypothetical protein